MFIRIKTNVFLSSVTLKDVETYLNFPLPASVKSLEVPPNSCNKMPFLISTFS